MAKKASPEGPETPEALLKRTTAAIRTTKGADLDLLDILVEKILTPAPAENAVAAAVEAIETLADKRAAEAGDDGPDQN